MTQYIKKEHLNDKRFLLMCLMPIVLHGISDIPINASYCIVQVTVTVMID